MTKSYIWIHEEALRLSHPVFPAAPSDAEAIFIWDDAYLQEARYSLKRLVFIYETVCSLPVKVLRGDTVDTLYHLPSSALFVPYSQSALVRSTLSKLSKEKAIHVVGEESFVSVPPEAEFKRFFRFWSKAEKTALTLDGKGN